MIGQKHKPVRWGASRVPGGDYFLWLDSHLSVVFWSVQVVTNWFQRGDGRRYLAGGKVAYQNSGVEHWRGRGRGREREGKEGRKK